MNNVTFKIAKKGEGKTRWLLELAYKYAGQRKIYLYTTDTTEYHKFCEKYFSLYNQICPVELLTEPDETEQDVVLVDNLFKCDSNTSNFTHIQKHCYKLFITLEGEQADA